MFSRATPDPRPPWLRWFLFKVPTSATGDWWDRRDAMLRRRAPIRYAFQHDIPIIVRRQGHRLNQAWWKVRHRTTDKYHLVDTGLKPGYYEINDRMLHAAFALLVEYVEIGLASRNYSCKSKDPKVRGLLHLEWEITEPACAGHQAETAKKVKDLYLWWTVERPERLDSWSAPEIWGTERAERKNDYPPIFRFFGVKIGRRRPRASLGLGNRTQDERDAGNLAGALDEFYSAQDDSMLINLAETRSSLWT